MRYLRSTLPRSHNLLADEIAGAIHSLASVNIGWFFGHFLPTFLATCEGVDNMQRATLLGNFDKSTVSQIHASHAVKYECKVRVQVAPSKILRIMRDA